MKKLSIFAVAFAAVLFAACTGNKSANNAEEADSLKSFEQEQIELSIKMHFDSIASELSKLKQPDFLKEEGNTITLSKEEKQVKPDYLLPASIAEEATTLAEKYRILSALTIDKAIAKLAADINDPSFKAVEKTDDIYKTTSDLYDAMNENGRINYFWQIASAALVEQLYVVSQNKDKFLSTFTDETAANVTFRIVLILDAMDRLSQYDTEIQPVAEAVAPLNALNATTVDELKSQLAEAKDKIDNARKALIKE